MKNDPTVQRMVQMIESSPTSVLFTIHALRGLSTACIDTRETTLKKFEGMPVSGEEWMKQADAFNSLFEE